MSKKVKDYEAFLEKLTSIYWWPELTALWPWKFKKPAVLLIALTEATKGFLLHDWKSLHAVLTSIVIFILWAKSVDPGFWGSGNYSSSSAAHKNSDCLGEHAYSHQNLFIFTAQISQPPPFDPKRLSIALRLSAVLKSLNWLQQTGFPIYSLHAVTV